MKKTELKFFEVTTTSGDTYKVSYWEVNSDKPGPVVLITAGLHGVEINGCEVIRRFLPVIDSSIIKGSCLLVPFANPIALQKRQPHIDFNLGVDYSGAILQFDNVNITFPGDPEGTNAQKLSYAITQNLVQRATHNIDLHSWFKSTACTALCREGNFTSIQFGNVSGILFARLNQWHPEKKQRPVIPCTLTSYFNDTGRAAMCIEFSGQYEINEREVRLGLKAFKNIFCFLGMIDGEIEKEKDSPIWLNSAEKIDIFAPADGVFVQTELYPSKWVENGQLLGYIFNEKNLQTIEVFAPDSGYLYQYGAYPEGDLDNPMKHYHPYVKKGKLISQIIVNWEGKDEQP